MPTFVSKGIWYPAKEYAVDPNAPKGHEVYEGPDRAALEMMAEAGLYDLHTKEYKGYFGQDIFDSQEMMDLARQRGFESVEDYLKKRHGWTKEKFEASAKKNMEVVNEHKAPAKKAAIKELGGGYDSTRQGQDKFGGFEPPQEAMNAPKFK